MFFFFLNSFQDFQYIYFVNDRFNCLTRKQDQFNVPSS